MQTRSAATSSCCCQPVFPKSASKKLKSLRVLRSLREQGYAGGKSAVYVGSGCPLLTHAALR